MCHLLDIISTPKKPTCFSILREDEILRKKSSNRSNTRCFFPQLRQIESNSILSLRHIKRLIRLIHRHHCIIHLSERLIINVLFISTIINNITFFITNSKAFDFVQLALEIHVCSELMLKHVEVNNIHCTEMAFMVSVYLFIQVTAEKWSTNNKIIFLHKKE